MAEVPNGLEVLAAKVERRSRAVPPPRRPRDPDADEEPTAEAAPEPAEGAAEAAPERRPRRAPNARPKAPMTTAAAVQVQPVGEDRPVGERPRVGPDEPLANLAVRVRRSLDHRLGDLLHSLKGEGVRSSKVEIIEMLLWELPGEPNPEFRRRLGEYRRAAPREEQL